MAQIDFPNSPINNQTVVVNGVTYTYDSTKTRWNRTVNLASGGGSGGASVTVGTTAPTSPSNGDLWFDSEDLLLYMYYADTDSNQWVQVVPAGTSLSTGVSPPTTADAGDLWFDPVDLILYVLYNDGSSTQWVKATPGIGDQISRGNTLTFTATDRVQVTGAPFKFPQFTSVQRDALTAEDGDMIYNTDNNRFEAYANSSWVSIDHSIIV